jgi:hypothetical protein
MTEHANLVIDGRDAETAFTDARTELDRHQLRRGAGVPTISVLAGATSTAIAVWRQWSLARGRPVVVASHTDQGRIVREWLVQLSEDRGLVESALACLAEASGCRVGELEQSLAGKTAHERTVSLRSLVDRAADRDAGRLCRWILEWPEEEPPDAERLFGALSALFADRECPAVSGLAVMNRPPATDATPTLLIVPPENVTDSGVWINAAVQTLMPIALEVSSLPVALAIPALDFERYVESAHESRGVAMLRETVVRLEGLDASAIRRHVEQAVGGSASCLEGSIHRLSRDGCSRELAHLFTEAASAQLTGDRMTDSQSHERSPNREQANEKESDIPSVRADDAARSAAERFLFERLQSLPETKGIFELNGKLSAEFGPADEAEVDLLGRKLRMAIEIDGYYHFQDPACYRRDRRKDVALQKVDYFVLRVLAEDVVVRLGSTLDVILDAVSFRRNRLGAKSQPEA